MDPSTVLTTTEAGLKAASQLSVALFTFIQDAKPIDQTLSSFFVDVQVLRAALTSIADSLLSTLLRKPTSTKADVDLWGSTDDVLHECNKTCEELLEILQGIRRNRSKSSSMQQTKLDWESENIRFLRSKIQNGTTSLQSALQVINLWVRKFSENLQRLP
jgi:hypothetical protein